MGVGQQHLLKMAATAPHPFFPFPLPAGFLKCGNFGQGSRVISDYQC